MSKFTDRAIPKEQMRMMLGATLMIPVIPFSFAADLPLFKTIDPSRIEMLDARGEKKDAYSMSGASEELSELNQQQKILDIQQPENAPSKTPSRPFTVKHVELSGVSVYPEEKFRPLLAKLEGKSITLQQVNAVAQLITQQYRNDGYLLVRTFVPYQQIVDGQIRIQVIEGKINHVNNQGDTNKAMKRYADNILQDQPLTSAQLERNLLLMNDLPGNVAQGTLSPSTESAGSDLLITNELQRWDGFLGIDNRDSRYYGSWQGYGGLNLNNPFDLGDRLSARYGHSFESNFMAFYEGQYEAPINRYGTTMSVLYQHSDGHPDIYSFLNANSHGDNIIARLNHPWVRSRMKNINTSIAFTWYNGTSEYLNDPDYAPSSDDKIRALRFGSSWDFIDVYHGSNLIKMELSQGLHVMNASHERRQNPSRENGKTNFTKLQIDIQRLQNLDPITSGLGLYIATSAQTAFNDPLLTPEQFGIGGSQFGRGYDPSEIAGDSGIAGKTELQYSKQHVIQEKTIPVQYYSFWDIGKVWNNKPRYEVTQSLASVGAGARINILTDSYITGEVAFPLTRPVAAEESKGYNGNKARFYFNFLKTF
ncbi:ShlB/FhaC/HecB family hemolysin secretion/activation protein [Yersinia massiliensis]|uniref:ShlB/FhaC/HecB family hemolysin secretion/activation protein n=1 Tax=Yersinia massiliensis TaxID=419257 RepID=UPI0002D88B15|nr:ShlB/FhaC/HecB family hemolysin secretion/activation protein [Yersinia massiliensis]